jgi:DNA-binding PadR family transcriptional regulator
MKAELLILGVLHRGNFHPYEIKRRLTNAMLECYTDVDVGTLYYAVRELAKDGLIAPVTRERVARGGMRTVYGITAKGRRRFQELLNAHFEAEGSVADTLYGAMLFLHLSDLPRTADLLRNKIARQTEAIRKLTLLRKQLAPVLSTGGLHLLTHLSLQGRLDRKWLKAVLADVIAGRVRDVPDPKRLAGGKPGRASRRSSGIS